MQNCLTSASSDCLRKATDVSCINWPVQTSLGMFTCNLRRILVLHFYGSVRNQYTFHHLLIMNRRKEHEISCFRIFCCVVFGVSQRSYIFAFIFHNTKHEALTFLSARRTTQNSVQCLVISLYNQGQQPNNNNCNDDQPSSYPSFVKHALNASTQSR